MLTLFKKYIIRKICMYLHKCLCFSSYLTFYLLHFLMLQTLHPYHLETKKAETKKKTYYLIIIHKDSS